MALLIKLWPLWLAIVASSLSFIGGERVGFDRGFGKAQKFVTKCPDCNCPPAVEVSLQNFDVTKINNKKGAFTYAPSLDLKDVNVTLKLDCADSLLAKKLVRDVRPN